MLRCIIVEDEPLAAQKLQDFITRLPNLHCEAWFANPLEALTHINTHKPDVLFLDIEMEQLSGLQLLQTIGWQPAVILTTAYQQHALRAFDLNVTDYLLKPFSFERFVQAVNKIPTPVASVSQHQQHRQLFLKNGYCIENINSADILYVEGQKEYLQIVCRHKKLLVLMSFSQLLEQLPDGLFVRVHRSWIVAIKHIESIEHDRILIANTRIPISDSYRSSFYETIQAK